MTAAPARPSVLISRATSVSLSAASVSSRSAAATTTTRNPSLDLLARTVTSASQNANDKSLSLPLIAPGQQPRPVSASRLQVNAQIAGSAPSPSSTTPQSNHTGTITLAARAVKVHPTAATPSTNSQVAAANAVYQALVAAAASSSTSPSGTPETRDQPTHQRTPTHQQQHQHHHHHHPSHQSQHSFQSGTFSFGSNTPPSNVHTAAASTANTSRAHPISPPPTFTPFTPLPPSSVAPPSSGLGGRMRKSLLIHTSIDFAAPIMPAASSAPPASYTFAPPPHYAQPSWHMEFDTTLADARMPSSGVTSPDSLTPRHLPPSSAALADDIVHPFVPFGAQQTQAMQVEDAMEEIMDRPIPAVDLESDQVSPFVPEKRLRKTMSSAAAAAAAASASVAPCNTPRGDTRHIAHAQHHGSQPSTAGVRPASRSTLSGTGLVDDHAPTNGSFDSTTNVVRPNTYTVAATVSPNSHTVSPRQMNGQYPPSLPISGLNSSTSSTGSLHLAVVAGTMPVDVALPLVQAAVYDECSPEYQQYKSAWLADREQAAREQLRSSQLDRAVQQGLLPKHHARKASRSMFDSTPYGSGATSPIIGSPLRSQASSPLPMLTHRHTRSGVVSPLHARSLSPLGTPHSPTIFATLLETNSRNGSRAISPATISPSPSAMSLALQHTLSNPPLRPLQRHHRPHAASVHSPPTYPRPVTELISSLSPALVPASASSSESASGSPSPPPPRQGGDMPTLYESYDDLRLGWIPSDLALTGAIPVPYK